MSQVELHIFQEGRPERRLVLHAGVVHIGRADDNEVVLADVGVSRRHARLEVGDHAVVVEDLGSGNGTWFRGQSVQRQVLGDGEEVAIDPFTLRVVVLGGMDTHEVTAGRDSTTGQPSSHPAAMLTVTSAHRMPVRSFPLPEEGVLTLGRSDRNAIVLPEPASSRVHAEVRCEDGRYTLRDHGSSNGTFVNGRRVKERVLEEGDRVRIGTVELRFSSVVEAEGTEAFQEPIVVAPEVRTLPPPPPPPPATAAFVAPMPEEAAAFPPPAAFPPAAYSPPAAEELEVNPQRASGKRLRSGPRPKRTGFLSRPINQVSLSVLALTLIMLGGKLASQVLTSVLKWQTGTEEVAAAGAPASTPAAPVVAPAAPAGDAAPVAVPPTVPAAAPAAGGDPGATGPLMAEGMKHFAEGKYFDAAGSFYRVLQIDPNHVDARRMGYVACEFITLAEVRAALVARSTTESARAAARTAALDAMTRLGAREISVADARPLVDAALALSPEDAELLAARDSLEATEASVARAVTAGKAAAVTRDLEGRLAEAKTDLAQGRYSRAVRGFEAVMAADPARTSPQYHAAAEGVTEAKDKMKFATKTAWAEANSAIRGGNHLTARKLLLEVLATDPYNEAAEVKLTEVRTALKEQASDFYKEARTLEGLGQNEKAIALYHKVQLYVGDDSDPLAQKARTRTDALLR